MASADLHPCPLEVEMGVPAFLLHLFRQEPNKLRLVKSLALGSRGGDRQVTSRDGTPLSVRRTGEGVPIVLVHGTPDGIAAFSLLEIELAEHHAVWAYDRRGRGGSGDAGQHSIEREVEDLEAVIAAAGGTPHVVAHSYGAVVALRAAVSEVAMRSLVLYEPPLNSEHITEAKIDQIRDAVNRDEPELALRTMATDLAGVLPAEVDIAVAVPPVRDRLFDGIRTAPRELQALRDVDWPEDRVPLSGVPTLVLLGERDSSDAYPREGEMSSWVDDVEIDTIPDQGHMAIAFAPHDVATRILRFVDRY